MHNFGKPKQLFLAAVTVGLLGFVVYIDWIAGPNDLKAIGDWQVDKFAHLSGGIFLALAIERLRGGLKIRELLWLLIFVTLGWEVFEFFLDPETHSAAMLFPMLWALDSIGDIAAAFLGAFGYGVFATRTQKSLDA